MSKVWIIMLISAIAALLFTRPDAAIAAMIDGSHSAVELAIELVALYAFWLGFFAIIEKTGLSKLMARLLKPLTRFLFKDIDDETEKYITMNMSANLLGLGNAATPMGISAINRLSEGKKFATSNMIMMIVISATSLQLLPSTVIGMRASHGSASPASFLPASIIATVLSTVLGIMLVKLFSRIMPDEKYAAKSDKKLAKMHERATLKSEKPAKRRIFGKKVRAAKK